MKRSLILAVLAVPAAASAQVPVYPGGAVPSAPTTLDPSATGSQAPPPPAPVAPAPNPVVVVKPDGTTSVVGGAATDAAPTGYYVGGGDHTVRDREPLENRSGPVPELHVVRKGDTLWDICWFYFNDPWQWPKIWSYNPQITNPHWIYPGDLVRLLPRGMFAQTDHEPEKGNDVGKPPELPLPAQKHEVGLKQMAFVEQSDLEKAITIDGSVDEKVLLGRGDSVYLKYPSSSTPQVGQRYSIYVPDNELHPDRPGRGKGGNDLGAYVHIIGSVEVVSVKQDKRARGVIIESNREIERGMNVGPLIKEYKNVPPVAAKVDAHGKIIAMLTADSLIGQGELVFLDLGRGAGLEVGNRMFVVRRGDAKPPHLGQTIGQDNPDFPARQLGEIVIVEVDNKISVGLVTLSEREMGVGDMVMMQAAK